MRLLLVHGMGRTPLSLARLSRALRRDGHQVERVGYVAAVESFDSRRSRVRGRLEALARRGEPYAVIGHSLGGLALRASLDGLAPPPCHFVMLGVPNQPPRLAAKLGRFWPYRWVCGESGQLLWQQSFFAQLPVPPVPYTIIAGSGGPQWRRGPFAHDANDWIVAVDETRLLPNDEPVILSVGHTFMMNHRQVRAAIRHALEQAVVE